MQLHGEAERSSENILDKEGFRMYLQVAVAVVLHKE